MPSHILGSFASAAARNTSQDGGSLGRGSSREDGNGSGDWNRARPNGAGTATFRRPSHTTSTSQSSLQNPSSTPPVNATGTSNVYVPPHQYQSNLSSRSGNTDLRYSKDQLLGLYKGQKDAGELGKSLTSLFVGSWQPKGPDLHSSGGWSSKDDQRKDGAPEICWESSGDVGPLGLLEMDDDERDQFSTSINSPLKPPAQNASKEQGQQGASTGRRSSVNLNSANVGAFAQSPPASARPITRRRETSDSIPRTNTTASPNGGSRFFRDETSAQSPPPLLVRRRTDFRDVSSTAADVEKDRVLSGNDTVVESQASFPNMLRRSATGPLSASGTGPSSPWSSGGGSFSPMGSFGNFGAAESPAQPPTPGEKKYGSGATRGGSRWSKFMGKDGSDEVGSRLTDKPSMSSLDRVSEVDAETPVEPWRGTRTLRSNNDTDIYGKDEGRTGSAALHGATDMSPPYNRAPGMGTPTASNTQRPFGFSDMDMSTPHQGARDTLDRSGQHISHDSNHPAHEPLSPTETNPYQSPFTDKADSDDVDTDDSEIRNLNHPGLSGMSVNTGNNAFGAMPRPLPYAYEAASDRSQNSSVGPMKNFPPVSGLGGVGGHSLPGWPTIPGALGTPDREKGAFQGPFGNSVFGSLGDLQSPGLSGMGGGMFTPTSNAGFAAGGTAGRGSKLGSLFPAAMQAQMYPGAGSKAHDDGPHNDGSDAPRSGLPLESGRHAGETAGNNFSLGARETDSPLRSGRGMFDDMLFAGMEGGRPPLTTVKSTPADNALAGYTSQNVSTPTQLSAGTSSQPLGAAGQTQAQTSQASQAVQSQQRTMVMPDRMRWIYKDPQGSVQGPWSGLEMHDWFKAGFFSAELLVKKFEDPEFEPLGQMIRRIGNSREPFLVPQIGIAHGPSNGPETPQWTAAGAAPGPNQPLAQGGSVQPPFAGAFPSFGTTLTAEQQNALERRKQEEQFLMARQKEYLAQQHVIQKQLHTPHGQQLHHNSSAHSLQSQPSFGSITSPGTFHPTPPQGPVQPTSGVPGYFESQSRHNTLPSSIPTGSLSDLSAGGSLRDEELAALLARQNLGNQGPLGPLPNSMLDHQPRMPHLPVSPNVAAMLAQRAQLEREQAEHDAAQQSIGEPRDGNQRFEQFHELRAQRDQYLASQGIDPMTASSVSLDQHAQEGRAPQPGSRQDAGPQPEAGTVKQARIIAGEEFSKPTSSTESLSLTQQVQKAASAKQPTGESSSAENAWGRVEPVGLPQPFPPPPQSISPLPAPAAQRNRQHLPDSLSAESRSQSQTPSAEGASAAASIAPWAKETNEGARGPSLKQIQEAESRKAAKAEEAAAAARRAQLEQERINLAYNPPAPAPGLPTSSTWASGSSPAASTTGATAWAKPLAGKPISTGKKTLSQIQQEEEARKQKLAASALSGAAGTPSSGQSSSSGKRYADLASKAAMVAQPPAVSGPWMTVGASGKPKVPAVPAVSGPPGLRIASGGALPTMSHVAGKGRPAVAPVRSLTAGGALPGQQSANDEFTRWAKSALAKGLNTNINVDDFVQQLLMFPSEAEIISESVYANSQTMDGRRFAEEFLRRRKLADKGVTDSSPSAHNGTSPAGAIESKSVGGGGWSEVAKKGPAAKEAEPSSAFKVVAAKKKGRK